MIADRDGFRQPQPEAYLLYRREHEAMPRHEYTVISDGHLLMESVLLPPADGRTFVRIFPDSGASDDRGFTA